METDTLTLEQVTDLFNEWRQTRQSNRERTPEALQQQAVALEGDYRRSQIITALGLNHTQYMTWHRRWSQALQPVTFLALPPAEDLASLVLHHPSGVRLTLNGALSASQLSAVVRGFVQASTEAL